MGWSEEGVLKFPFPSSLQEPWESEKQQLLTSRIWPDTRNSPLGHSWALLLNGIHSHWHPELPLWALPTAVSDGYLTGHWQGDWPQWIKTKTRSLQHHVLFSHSVVYNSSAPWTAARQASLSISNSRSYPNSCPLSQWCHPTISSSPLALLLFPSISPSIRVFSHESVLRIRWPKYWRFSFSTSPSNEYSGLISFRMDWFDVLAVQGTLKSLLQHHNSKTSILRHSAFLMVQLSQPHMTIGKIIALTKQTFVGKMMSLLFNTLSRFVIACFPRSKHFLTLWLQSPSTLILETKKMKSDTV